MKPTRQYNHGRQSDRDDTKRSLDGLCSNYKLNLIPNSMPNLPNE